jgi:hypothetical protein
VERRASSPVLSAADSAMAERDAIYPKQESKNRKTTMMMTNMTT